MCIGHVPQYCEFSLESQSRAKVSVIGTRSVSIEYHEFSGYYDYNVHESGIKLTDICFSVISMPKESSLSLLSVKEVVKSDENRHKRRLKEFDFVLKTKKALATTFSYQDTGIWKGARFFFCLFWKIQEPLEDH